MLQSIAMKAEQQISSLIANWNADVAYMELWESYLSALEVREEIFFPPLYHCCLYSSCITMDDGDVQLLISSSIW